MEQEEINENLAKHINNLNEQLSIQLEFNKALSNKILELEFRVGKLDKIMDNSIILFDSKNGKF